MYERFTEAARRVTVLASEEARMQLHNFIGTEHLLLAMLAGDDSIARRALEACGMTLEVARAKVEEIVGHGQQSPSGHIPFTPRAKKVLELALQQSLQINSSVIGPEHILLGLIREGEGVGSQVLLKCGVPNLQVLRGKVFEQIARDGGSDDRAEAEETVKVYVLPVSVGVVDIHQAVELCAQAAIDTVKLAIEQGDTTDPAVLYHRAFELVTRAFKQWANEAEPESDAK